MNKPVPGFRIGPVHILEPFLIAPMAGYTDSSFRSICLKHHAGAAFTEVTNAEGVARKIRKTLLLLEARSDEKPLAAHIYGCKPDVLAQAAVVIENLGRFAFLDINAGCPVRKIVAKGSGAALMKNPAHLELIVRTVCSATTLPVTVKTRIGLTPDSVNIREIAHAAESGGAAALTIHGRVASRVHSGPADWDLIAAIKRERTIPVIGNGGITSAETAIHALHNYGVDGVMIGRGAIGRPWIFDEIRALQTGQPFTPPIGKDKREAILDHFDRLLELKIKEAPFRRSKRITPECAAALHFRSHLYKYLSGTPGWAEVRRNLQKVNSRAAVVASIDQAMNGSLP